MNNELLNFNLDNAKSFILENYITEALVYKVYDGDTISILFKYRDEFLKDSCRIYGIDTPEMRSCDKEKELAYKARDFLSSLILNKIIKVHFLNLDKYGRPLIRIYLDNSDIGFLMIEKGYAKEYNGGTKQSWI